MAARSDTTAAVATSPRPRLKRPRTATSPPRDRAESASGSLDSLPPELLLEIVSWLDWSSLRTLSRVSRRCLDAVSSHLGRLRVLHFISPDMKGVVKTSADLTALLAPMTSLRALYVDSCSIEPKEVLEALVACSWRMPLLQKLDLDLYAYPTELLTRFCAGCEMLSEVKLGDEADDEAVEAVLAGQPDLLVLDVNTYEPVSLRGDFFTRLPTKLRRLAVNCKRLRSSALRELARCGELRSLELDEVDGLRQEDLATGLAGCVRLERLFLRAMDVSFTDCLPPAGLPALRRLELLFCTLPDSGLQQLVLRQPNLETVFLKYCSGSTQRGLALLGKLPALTSLNLFQTEGVSDWALAQLSTTRLAELQVGDDRDAFAVSVTAEGLLRLSQTCPSLRKITLWYDEFVMESANCGPGTDEVRLLEWLRACLSDK